MCRRTDTKTRSNSSTPPTGGGWNSSLRPRSSPKVSTIFRQARRGILKEEAAHRAWESLINAPIYTYAPEDLIERAAELHFESGASIYDSLFLALAEESNTIVATADDKLTKKLEGTEFAHLALSLSTVARTLAGNS